MLKNRADEGENGTDVGESGAEDGENRTDDGKNGAAEDPQSFSDNMRMNVLKKTELDIRCLQLKVQETKLRLQRTLLVEEQVDLIYKGLLASSEVREESKEA
ncbi:hypothetical protein TSUD_159960 [Trifolium subterraneum]|uniref:Uncharacterized protein n=1 Tax=Trifolium subterraneum TaxID=3900 RepID=A0A2Z6MS96_TRISU|nr:hypothetical protein TSUD_159960 [Trifolium subterraneum]